MLRLQSEINMAALTRLSSSLTAFHCIRSCAFDNSSTRNVSEAANVCVTLVAEVFNDY